MYPGCIFMQISAKTCIYMARDIGGTYRNCGTGFSLRQNDTLRYSAFTCSGSCPVLGHVILTCKLHVGGKI